MKKFKTVLTAIAMLFATSSFAAEPVNVSQLVKNAFENAFPQAVQVKWEKTDDFYFASFTLNDTPVDAAFNEMGMLVGTSRRIDSGQMPLGILLEIDENYEGYKIGKSAVELTYQGLTRYYVTLENETEVVKLKCYSSGEIRVEQKTKK